jgi:hypothetical protein
MQLVSAPDTDRLSATYVGHRLCALPGQMGHVVAEDAEAARRCLPSPEVTRWKLPPTTRGWW